MRRGLLLEGHKLILQSLKNTCITRRGPKLKVSRGVMLFVGSLAEGGPRVLQSGGKFDFSCSKIVDS